MDIPQINIKSNVCQKHNQQIRYYDKNGRNPQCEDCLLQKGELITFEQIQKQYQEIIINNNKQINLQQEQLHALKDGIMKYKENIISSVSKSIQQITDQIQSIQSQKQSMQQLEQIINQYESIEDFQHSLNNIQKSNRQTRNHIIIDFLRDIKSKVGNKDFFNSLLNKQIQISEMITDQQNSPQEMEYELILSEEPSSLKISDFAIDQRNNILIAGTYGGVIKIYNFQNGKVGDEIQNLKAHTNIVNCLYSMKNSHSFYSGGRDKKIIIWCFDQANKWQVQQILNSHKQDVYCMIMNSKEDLLISGGYDLSVKFWRKKTDYWKLQQTVDINNLYCKVHALSLNQKEDKLIVCTCYYEIKVLNNGINKKWKNIQTIQINEWGFRLCFTIQDQFVFQPLTSEYLEVYDYDVTKQQFYQMAKVNVQSVSTCSNSFPCQYIKKLNILAIKHGQFVNIFKINQNGEYQKIQTIEYQYHLINGKITDDGDYFLIQDQKYYDIQVRKLKFKKKSF